MRACLPAGSALRCQKDPSWRADPVCQRIVRYYGNPVSGTFFTHSRKIGSGETGTRDCCKGKLRLRLQASGRDTADDAQARNTPRESLLTWADTEIQNSTRANDPRHHRDRQDSEYRYRPPALASLPTSTGSRLRPHDAGMSILTLPFQGA